jgi:hypothetical protein
VAIALYDLSVANYLQTLGAVVGFLEKGLAHFTTNHVDLDEIVETRLAPDMLPFRFQLQSVAHHSLGAIEGVKKDSSSHLRRRLRTTTAGCRSSSPTRRRRCRS